ncbi:hypothetical protein H5410_060042 [Solanum commersonii]|uniref:Uncharacterized protein n=1 Tax=Solanum commersonii TaxID=4109 RepID=A0A9J5W4T7_SOLCO|nr:hypothetical protein H5410_060042 [Solanum commersonii]
MNQLFLHCKHVLIWCMFLNLHGIQGVMPEFKPSIVQMAGPEDKEETEADNEDHPFMHSVDCLVRQKQ